ncbi:PfkB family carbohydrate kinase [Salinibacterium sp. G-O1]|uniref:carbohydrate kinase family protein n=1 Tax=Salinibacterium sp. G-O1 TaxID=3046208 RepID=UPI0024B946AE|nr:PfkB family carbohydrate kinase [Salinibacterium sp. G-O1]MDJ0336340.1 PfkB family carbohydrate kinase [Salinibacterium sp. G-O1]
MADRIVVFGDVIDDVVAMPYEAIRLDTDTAASIGFRAGGSAANTAAWLGYLGARVDFVGVVGAADLERHTALLVQTGVTTHLRSHPTMTTGTIVIIVEGEHRTMLTERGANTELDPADVTAELLAEAAVLHLTGHSLLNAAGSDGLVALVARAKKVGAKVSVDPGSAGFIADYGVDRFLEAVAGAEVLFPSLEEGRVLTGLHDPTDIAVALAKDFATVVLTMGAGGVVIANDDTVLTVPAVSSPVVDPTGAGDAFCAGFLSVWVRSGDLARSASAGAKVAAKAVAGIGGRPHR